MIIRPVKRYAGPKYPVRQIIDEHPELLQLVPRRWQTNPVVLSALAGLCVVMLGCRNGQASASSAPRVAPVFQHGTGRGSFGCDSVNPPVFLSEDEARQVVVEEAKRQGVSFSAPGPELSDVLTTTYNRTGADITTKKQPLALDGKDTARKVYFEFVSTDDLMKWEEPPMLSCYDHNSLGAAKTLRTKLQKTKSDGTYAVFYDPFVKIDMDKAKKDDQGRLDWDAWLDMRDTQGKQMAKDELRAQVQDFIKWLKTQGVI